MGRLGCRRTAGGVKSGVQQFTVTRRSCGHENRVSLSRSPNWEGAQSRGFQSLGTERSWSRRARLSFFMQPITCLRLGSPRPKNRGGDKQKFQEFLTVIHGLMAKSLRLIATGERGHPGLNELEASFGMIDAIVALNAGKRQVDVYGQTSPRGARRGHDRGKWSSLNPECSKTGKFRADAR